MKTCGVRGLAKPSYGQNLYRGFESPPLRQNILRMYFTNTHRLVYWLSAGQPSVSPFVEFQCRHVSGSLWEL
jgi:hypothetical protein